MKIKFLLATVAITMTCYSQKKVTLSNYYDYYVKIENKSNKGIVGNNITTSWLKKEEIVPILMEELKNAGHEWLYSYSLFKIQDGQYIVLSAYSRKSNFGFLYIDGHDAIPKKSHRSTLTQKTEYGVDYISYEETPSGNPNMVNIEKLPHNILVLNENCYWYQSTEIGSDNSKLVSKEDAIRILREDIKNNLNHIKKRG